MGIAYPGLGSEQQIFPSVSSHACASSAVDTLCPTAFWIRPAVNHLLRCWFSSMEVSRLKSITKTHSPGPERQLLIWKNVLIRCSVRLLVPE